jgi:hypothetical protein
MLFRFCIVVVSFLWCISADRCFSVQKSTLDGVRGLWDAVNTFQHDCDPRVSTASQQWDNQESLLAVDKLYKCDLIPGPILDYPNNLRSAYCTSRCPVGNGKSEMGSGITTPLASFSHAFGDTGHCSMAGVTWIYGEVYRLSLKTMRKITSSFSFRDD